MPSMLHQKRLGREKGIRGKPYSHCMLETPADVSESSIMCRMECTNGQKQCSSFELGTKSETINILEGLFSNTETKQNRVNWQYHSIYQKPNAGQPTDLTVFDQCKQPLKGNYCMFKTKQHEFIQRSLVLYREVIIFSNHW